MALTSVDLKSAIVLEPLVVSPDTTVMAAIAQMSGVRSRCATTKATDGQLDDLYLEARSSCVLVMEDGQVIGNSNRAGRGAPERPAATPRSLGDASGDGASRRDPTRVCFHRFIFCY